MAAGTGFNVTRKLAIDAALGNAALIIGLAVAGLVALVAAVAMVLRPRVGTLRAC